MTSHSSSEEPRFSEFEPEELETIHEALGAFADDFSLEDQDQLRLVFDLMNEIDNWRWQEGIGLVR